MNDFINFLDNNSYNLVVSFYDWDYSEHKLLRAPDNLLHQLSSYKDFLDSVKHEAYMFAKEQRIILNKKRKKEYGFEGREEPFCDEVFEVFKDLLINKYHFIEVNVSQYDFKLEEYKTVSLL